MSIRGCVLALLCLWGLARCDENEKMDDYLHRFGYTSMAREYGKIVHIDDMRTAALMLFQERNGLNVTGEMDQPTEELMAMPRCGNTDVDNSKDMARRKKRFATQGSKWPKSHLTYKITTYTFDLSQGQVDSEIARAFKVWSDVTPLTFTQVAKHQSADIVIFFKSRAHGDNDPFDGRGQTLAHAFFPRWGGDAHFDEDEPWTINTNSGINLFQVAAHEFGHSLGLTHSADRNALMAPFYRGFISNFQLPSDDIMGIQTVYGPNNKATPPVDQTSSTTSTRKPRRTTTAAPQTRPTVPPKPNSFDACSDGRIDAIVTVNSLVFGFRKDHYFLIDNIGIANGYPRRIADDWRNMPNDIDTALFVPSYYRVGSNQLFIFKDDMVYIYSRNQQFITSMKITQKFPGLPSNLDSAFIWSGNGKIYFTKGSVYYRVNKHTGRVDSGYPRPLRTWGGLPRQINAAVKYESRLGFRTYFFDGKEYYRFYDRTFNVDRGYPRSVARLWFGCKNSNVEEQTTPMMEMDEDVDMFDMDQVTISGMDQVTISGVERKQPLLYVVAMLGGILLYLTF